MTTNVVGVKKPFQTKYLVKFTIVGQGFSKRCNAVYMYDDVLDGKNQLPTPVYRLKRMDLAAPFSCEMTERRPFRLPAGDKSFLFLRTRPKLAS
jgi:hypothetical protein